MTKLLQIAHITYNTTHVYLITGWIDKVEVLRAFKDVLTKSN